MTISEIKNKIIQEDIAFVLSEHKKLHSLYALKKEIRYERVRDTSFLTESVAEHVYGMHCLCDYFFSLDERLASADVAKIHTMIQYHDIDEVKTGDIPNYLKDVDPNSEFTAAKEVILGLPEVMQETIATAMAEYHAQETIEAKFVKALDKVEPAFQCYDEEMKPVLQVNKISLAKGMKGKPKYLAEFPVIEHFNNVIGSQMELEGYFVAG